ncbi:MAG: LuxR family transcriptional regulator [Moraxellaceae bacterium]|jgi:PAS domain S-box-containing protein|nr:LuxR family transcriptional regulator [Moraxellaceae bacterium]
MPLTLPAGIADVQDLLPDAIFLVDAEGVILHVNASCEPIFGYLPQELINTRIIDLVAPADRDRTLDEARRVMEDTQRIGFENRYRHKQGHEVHVMWSVRWLAAEGLRVGVARDITALRQKAATAQGPQAPTPLSPQERRVLEMLLTDASERQIAARMELAESTIHSYIAAIFRKFGVRGRKGLMSLWLQHHSGPDGVQGKAPGR